MTRLPLVRIPGGTTIYRLGAGNLDARSALLRFGQKGWTISQSTVDSSGRTTEGWAIVGDAEGRRLAVETLLSRHRIHPAPPSPGAFPHVTHLLKPTPSTSTDEPPIPLRPIRHLAFARPPPSGEFTDFTARYGALQEEDKLSYRETLQSLHPSPSAADIDRVAQTMRISHLLDLPSVSFSSGQTRRGRIAAALLTRPVLLLLEDPMAGLDVQSRAEVSGVLGDLNANGGIRVVVVLRGKGSVDVPEWVTNVAEVRDGEVWIGTKEDWMARHEDEQTPSATLGDVAKEDTPVNPISQPVGEPLVELNQVTVSYGEGTREVLKGIDWTMREGEKWHLQGANGSGKTTLLSIILGHHPRSFSLPPDNLRLFSKPRRSIPTPTLRTLVGHTSPEIYAAFPRGMGLSALEAVGSGFEGVFSRRALNSEQKTRVLDLIQFFEPHLATGRTGPSASVPTNAASSPSSSVSVQTPSAIDTIARRPFAHFTPSQQALLLFLRALVARPRLVILDEPSQGVDEAIWERCKDLLRREWKERPEMCTVVVSHYEDEVPWGREEGRVMKLTDGRGEVQ